MMNERHEGEMMSMRRLWIRTLTAVFVASALVSWAPSASAEPREKAAGLGLVLVTPSFAPKSSTSPLAWGWGLQTFVQYGPDLGRWSWDVAVGLSMTWASFGATVSDFTYGSGDAVDRGELSFDGAYYHPEISIQYKVLSGYRFAPTVEASAGLMWLTFKNGTLSEVDGDEGESRVEDFGQGGATASVAFLVDYELVDYVHVSSSIKYTRAFSDLLRDNITVGLNASYRWW